MGLAVELGRWAKRIAAVVGVPSRLHTGEVIVTVLIAITETAPFAFTLLRAGKGEGDDGDGERNEFAKRHGILKS